LKTRSSFTVREVSPDLRFAEPHLTVLSIKRGAAAAQQFHITAAYQVDHWHLPKLVLSAPYAACATATLNRRDPFKSALRLCKEATVRLTDVFAGLELMAEFDA
jgi:hypothetical protein